MNLSHSSNSDPELNEILLGAYTYLCSLPGKDIRTQLINAFNSWFQVSNEKIDCIKDVIRMLHTSSLLVDDVEDNSDLRRGFPVAHKIYGIPATINTANYIYFLALKKVLELNDPNLVGIFTDELIQLHQGQGMELYWRDNLLCPTEDQYITMVSKKTGGLFRLAVRLIQASSSINLDVINLVDLLGVYFQIRDDLMNVKSTEYSDNKGFFEDITEGKFSYPIIHAINNSKDKDQLLNIMRQKTRDNDVKKYAAQLVEHAGSIDFTINTLNSYESQIRSEISKLPQNHQLVEILDYLCSQVKN
ncbi:hypothetical protein BB561_004316 [Smittium simulii]|uniref:Geranylgeranyl pyrophosphate synthase n=1 Tax=Smittium simulii TaxID=133385 RepID=A0A2T9YH18_9FUNG|nr:hypothetical protein BB561_004316 [Smittium simulii]